jgi:hypothetical protein
METAPELCSPDLVDRTRLVFPRLVVGGAALDTPGRILIDKTWTRLPNIIPVYTTTARKVRVSSERKQVKSER